MEDAHISQCDLDKDTHLFAVFDGHGGREVAKFAEKHFPIELLANENYKKGNYKTALEETFMKMDVLMRAPAGKKELQDFLANDIDQNDAKYAVESNAGCTSNVVLIVKNKIYCANAGDSRAALHDSNDKIVELSVDHKPDNEPEISRIRKADGYVSDGRINGNLNLSRALGDFEYKKNEKLDQKEQLVIAFPDVKEVTIAANTDFLLMGCDGIWESLSSEELCSEAAKLLKSNGNDPKKTVEDLLDKLCATDTSSRIISGHFLILIFPNSWHRLR